jgi:hypothetical protein
MALRANRLDGEATYADIIKAKEEPMSAADGTDDALDAVLSRLSARAKRPIDLIDLIERWSTFVTEVDRGYGATIYDYTNGLSVRDLLAEILVAIPLERRRAIEDAVANSDAIYQHATTASSRPLLPLAHGLHSWWWFRLPLRIPKELRDDLIADGFLSDPP